MSCQPNQTVSCEPARSSGNGFIIVIVLYILLAIILGSWVAC